ncbi:MAG: hypothetical protein ACYCOO_08905 [Chitinophagaceae bacterium]
MKTKKIKIGTKYFFLGILASVFIFSLGSCARKITFLASSVVPGAKGTVTVKKDNNKNYDISIHLFNLADPSKLQPPKQSYVVWMETDQNLTKNLGQINSSTSLLSKEMKGSFETVTPLKPRKIFITAEDDAKIQYPGTQVVLSTDNF